MDNFKINWKPLNHSYASMLGASIKRQMLYALLWKLEFEFLEGPIKNRDLNHALKQTQKNWEWLMTNLRVQLSEAKNIDFVTQFPKQDRLLTIGEIIDNLLEMNEEQLDQLKNDLKSERNELVRIPKESMGG